MIDRYSDTWTAVIRWALEQVETSRIRLEDVATAPTETAYHRGRTALARELLVLADPPPAPIATDSTPYT